MGFFHCSPLGKITQLLLLRGNHYLTEIFYIGVNNEQMTQSATRLLTPEQKQTSNGNICKVIKSKDYTVMSNIHLRDKKLSLKAKGLLSIVLSLPEDWNYTIAGLVSIVQEGEFSVRSALKELKDNGYLVINKILPNAQTKVLTYEYLFFESPNPPSLVSRSQDVGFQHLDKSPQLNIYKLNTYEPNKEIIISKPVKPVAGKRNSLQVFSNAVIEVFESKVQTEAQKGVWFRRNCRNLKDILSYCNNDIEAAMFTIDCTIDWLSQNNLQGGYEAVCRNLPEMYSRAMKRIEEGEKWVFSEKIKRQIGELRSGNGFLDRQTAMNNKKALQLIFDEKRKEES